MGSIYNNGTVSVIIPVYNAGKYIERTLQSALNQTYKDIEIIFVDDCSKDDSAEIIANYMTRFQNIVYYKLAKNMGAAVARNTALNIAKGRYVAFLDSDDQWLPQKLEKQLDLMKKKNVSLSYTAIEMIDEQDKLIKGKRNVRDHLDYKFLLHNTMIATSTVIVDRNLTSSFQMPLRRSGQDYATWLLLLRGGTIAFGLNEVLSRYRVTNDSLSSNKFKSIKQVWQIQTQDEHICKFYASVNVLCFIFNALKKYLV